MPGSVLAKSDQSLATLVLDSLKGIDIIRTENRIIFAADVKQIHVTPTPKDKILPAPIVLISNLYAESLREVQRESDTSVHIPVFAGGMAILSSLPAHRVSYKTALQALHRLFHVAKRKGLQSVNEEAFASWQSHCLRNFDKKTSVAMLIIDAGAGTRNDRDMLRRYGYECPDETDSPPESSC